VKESFSTQLEPKFKILAGIILAIFGLLIARLWILQIMEGADIMIQARQNQTRVIRINAPRGYFYDKKGEILVSTRISRNVSVVPEDVKDKPEVLKKLASILKMSVSEIRAKLKPDPKKIRTPYQYVTIRSDIDPATAIKLLEAQMDLPGVEVDEVPLRFYKYGEYASHLFGYIREINDDELAELKDKGYKQGDLIGKNGLERTYEQYLRGVDGGKIFEVDIYGRRKSKLQMQEPMPGNNLHLTIDHKVQLAAEKALDEQLLFLQ
jgi:penicillin-binding protein 2